MSMNSTLYCITSDDNIFVSAPPTFDPFVLDTFLALHNGATVVMFPLAIRLSPNHLAETVCRANITIMQLTPSVFKRWNRTHTEKVCNSSLRCLIFGGEPIEAIDLKCIDWSNDKLQLFNIYGCTEQSCWTTIHRIHSSDIDIGLIPIGHPISTLPSEIFIHRKNDEDEEGELHLKCNIRQCYEFGRSAPEMIATGDLVRQIGTNIYFLSRKDDVVKRFGTKVNIRLVADLVRNAFPAELSAASCALHRNQLVLFIVVTSTTLALDMLKKIRQFHMTLAANERPDRIQIVDRLPLNAHGKVSRSMLANWAADTNKLSNARDFLQAQFIALFAIDDLMSSVPAAFGNDDDVVSAKIQKTALHSSFFDCGGSSLMAIQLSNEIESKFGRPFDDLITLLLDRCTTIKEILDRVHLMEQHELQAAVIATVDDRRVSIEWNINMGKCIDATPTICHLNGEDLVCCGSHSHRVLIVRLSDGSICAELTLPDRVESQVLI